MYDNMQLDKNVKISVFLLNSNKNIASDLMKKVIMFFFFFVLTNLKFLIWHPTNYLPQNNQF